MTVLRKRSSQIATLIGVALLLAACGSSGGSKATTNTTAAAGTTGTTAAAQTTATGSVITFGFVDPDAGSGANPQIAPAEQAGLAYVNNVLGGIKGHKIRFIVCNSDESPAKAVSCANQFVQSKVVGVVEGFDRGVGSQLPILKAAGIPMIGNVAQSAQADADTDGTYWALGTPDAVYAIGPLQSFKAQGFTKISLALGDVPALHTYANEFLLPVAKALGLSFSAVYYNIGSPDFPVVAATLKASNPDLAGVVTLPNPGQCDQFVQAMRQAGYKKAILAGNCMNVTKDLGSAASNVEIYTNVWLPAMAQYAPPLAQKQVQITESALAATKSTSIGFYSYETFATVIDTARIAATATGPLTAATLKAALAATRNYQGWDGPVENCTGKVWPGSNACTAQLILGIAQPNGTMKPAGGGFVSVSSSLLPK